ncbi:MAG: AAA family ATPase [Deltaproteobacteria bacterium]|nr:AAA family ATPase [Deltaproteobacteria bacterium]
MAKKRRLDEEYSANEKIMNKNQKRECRLDEEYSANEKIMNKNQKRERRLDEEYRANEKEREKEKRKVRRLDPEYKLKEKELRIGRKYGRTLDECKKKFKEGNKAGPIYVCTSCHLLKFRKSVVELEKQRVLSSFIVNKYTTQKYSVDGKEWVCRMCFLYLRREKAPKYFGLKFPDKVDVLNLNRLEERCVATRIPFMFIYDATKGGQCKLRGSVANVPMDIQPIIKQLPHVPDESISIPLKFKRKQHFKTNEYFESIHPKKVIDAAKYLVKQPLYVKDGIELDNNINEQNFVDSDTDDETESSSSSDNESESDFSEVECELSKSGQQDTMVDDFNMDRFRPSGLTIAPGENEKSLSLFQTENEEYKAFPKIYCGQAMNYKEANVEQMSYGEQVKWELLNEDRRCAEHIPNIFYKTKKLQVKQVNSAGNIAVKKIFQDQKYTVSDFMKDDNTSPSIPIKNMDFGHKVFKDIRNSPPYLERVGKDIRAMIRQLGIPTWFVSLSANDLNWPELLIILGKLQDKKDYTDCLESLKWEDKIRLVRNDPVTCARYFQDKVDRFIENVLKSPFSPLGDILDYTYRVEFQHRGSPHIHMLIWVKDAPELDLTPENISKITHFIDKYVSCSLEVSDEKMQFIKNNIHKHSKTCRKMNKRNKKVCRFNFPIPPMKETSILQPLKAEKKDLKEHTDRYLKIRNTLKSFGNQELDMEFEEFLKLFECTYEQYISAIRVSLQKPQVFLKRSVKEIRVNPYMKNLADTWQANHDIQFVLDPYSCARYITDYISKSTRGMSQLLKKTCDELRRGDKSLKEQIASLGHKFLTAVEISAQEAVYLSTGIPLTVKSREVEFINTGRPNERVRMLKSDEDLQILKQKNPKATNVFKQSNIDRYQNRPKELNNYCLADFISELTYVPKKCNDDDDILTTHNPNSDNSNPDNNPVRNAGWIDSDDESESDNEDSGNEENFESLTNNEYTVHSNPNIIATCFNGSFYKKRLNPKVIRYRKYNRSDAIQMEDYYREKLMLFLPWRHELKDLLPEQYKSYCDHFTAVEDDLRQKIIQYDFKGQSLDDALRDANREARDLNDLDYSDIAPGTLAAEFEDEDEEFNRANEAEFSNIERYNDDEIVENMDITAPRINSKTAITSIYDIPGCVSRDDYLKNIEVLNKKQREFLYHVLHTTRTSGKPYHIFLTGGAGVGKSVLINALYECLQRYYIHNSNEEKLDMPRVMLMAQTGTAAFNIQGKTWNNAMKILPQQKYQQLSSSTAERYYREIYQYLKVIIIDEVSLIGNKALYNTHRRLCEIMHNDKPFGGVNVICVGDLFQLQPVMDEWIFKQLDNNDYGMLSTNMWQRYFKCYELDEIMRQKDDKSWAQLLNRLREGNHTDIDIKTLKSMILSPTHSDYPINGPHLFQSNAKVYAHNDDYFERNKSSDCYIVNAEHRMRTKQGIVLSDTEKHIYEEDMLTSDKYKITAQFINILKLCIGIPYMISNNIDNNDGLTNGASGILKYITFHNDKPYIVWIDFNKPKIGQLCRKKAVQKKWYSEAIDRNWTPIQKKLSRPFEYKPENNFTLTVTRKIFPLQMAASRTINKEQSQTRTVRGVLDFECNRTISALHYTGLSRFNKKENVVILNLDEEKISTNPDVLREMKRLRRPENSVQLSYLPVYSMPNEFVKIVFQNIGTLSKYLNIIKNDLNYTSADVLAFAESRLPSRITNEEISIQGFQEVIRNDLSDLDRNGNAMHGTAIYIREGFTIHSRQLYATVSIECSFLEISSSSNPTKLIQIAFLYVKNDCSKELLKATIKNLMMLINTNIPYLIVGDFNINEYDDSNQVILDDLSNITLSKQLVEQCTTECNTKIDLAYGNITSVGVISSMITYHSLITAQIDCKSKVDESVPSSSVSESDILISFVNGNSIDKHMKEVNNDQSILKSHIFGISDTNFDSNQEYDISDFTSIVRKDGTKKNKLNGIALYSKLDFDDRLNTNSNDIILVKLNMASDIQLFVAIIRQKTKQSLNNIMKYIKPLVRDKLQHSPSVIIGEFNESSDKTMLKEYFQLYNIQAIHEVGNGKRSNICFTNINAYSVGSHEINYLNNTLFSIKLQRSQIGTLLS